MKQCANGHIYDERKFARCPYCDNTLSNFGVTRPLAEPSGSSPAFPKTIPLRESTKPTEIGVTTALNSSESGINPVRGWLVVTEGQKKGASFEIHSEKNTIGRGAGFSVSLSFDSAASKEGDAIISYSARQNRFFLSPGEGKNNVYLNGEIFLQPSEIKDYDVLEIGKTKLVFRSFCNELFQYAD